MGYKQFSYVNTLRTMMKSAIPGHTVPSGENHQYAYASKMKVLGAVSASQMDIFLMNREAYDLISSSEFLMDMNELLKDDEALYQKVSTLLCTNTVILENNAVEFDLGEADQYEAVTEEAVNAIDVTGFPVFKDAGFGDTVYLSVVANTRRAQAALSYIGYLYGNR